jgi:hypothetical protein
VTLQQLKYACRAIMPRNRPANEYICSSNMISAQIVATRASWLLYRPVQPLILVSCVDQPRLLFKHKARSTDMAMQAYFGCCKVTMDYQHWYLGPNTQGEGRDLWIRPIQHPCSRGGCTAACCEWLIGIRCTCSGRLCLAVLYCHVIDQRMSIYVPAT